MSLRLFTMAALAAASSPGAAAPSPLKPTGKWVIDFAANQCAAVRPFGSESDPLHLVIKPAPTGDVVQISLVEKGPTLFGVQEDATLTFGGAAPVKVKQLHFGTRPKESRLVNLGAGEAALLRDSRLIEWRTRGRSQVIETGPMKQVMKVLADCRADLRKYWNIEPEQGKELRSEPATTKPLVNLFSPADYPRQAILNRESGVTEIVLLVDESGKLADCMVTATSGIPTLDAMTCIAIRDGAKFTPAIGADGKPARGTMTQKVRWKVY
jgi:TonB family protein